MNNNNYDLIIIGGGLAGSSLACALSHLPIRIAIIDQQAINKSSQTPTTNRPITLNQSSVRILNTMNIWNKLKPNTQNIQQLHISQQGRLGRILLQSKDLNITSLGHVVPFDNLQQEIQQTALNQSNVNYIHSEEISSIKTSTTGIKINLTTSARQAMQITGNLLIVADGVNSTCKKLLQIQSTTHNKDKQALIFSIKLTDTIEGLYDQHTAFQRFTNLGSIAWLPSWKSDSARIVWTLNTKQHQAIQHWQQHEIINHLNLVYRGKTKIISSLTTEASVPLLTSFAHQSSNLPIICIGNAAHSIPPITAQGYNLTLLSIAMLAEKLTDSFNDQNNIYCQIKHQEYLKWSLAAQSAIIKSTSFIEDAFGLQIKIASHILGAGLLAMDLCTTIKRKIIRHYLGIQYNMPKLASDMKLRNTTNIKKPLHDTENAKDTI